MTRQVNTVNHLNKVKCFNFFSPAVGLRWRRIFSACFGTLTLISQLNSLYRIKCSLTSRFVTKC
ncbi:hypothetical protein EDO6_05608 [Paenibacillus xylanexedens]|nr:hypothetical protein EDO6_05608 [Paenibacillus xylanexedens]